MAIDLKTLHSLARVRALRSQQKLDVLRQRETSLRAEMAALDEMRSAVDAPDLALQSMRGVGADLLWKAWLTRTRARLMTELAQVKALMEPLIAQARRDMGRSEAAKDIMTRETARKRAEQQQKQRERLLEQEVMRGATAPRDTAL